MLERLWQELRLDRRGHDRRARRRRTTDVAGFAAATYLRGVAWVAVPTTSSARSTPRSAARPAIDLPQGKNLVGAFHWPARTVIDPALLETLPERERRAGYGRGREDRLLAGEPLWELPTTSSSAAARPSRRPSACATRTTPASAGSSTSATRSRTRSRRRPATRVPHGEAVALGLLAALRLSGRDTGAGARSCCTRGRSGSTGSAPGRRCSATRSRRRRAAARPARRRRPPLRRHVPAADVRRELDALIAG